MEQLLEQLNTGLITGEDFLIKTKEYIEQTYHLNSEQAEKMVSKMAAVYGSDFRCYADYIDDYCDVYIELRKLEKKS